MDPPKPKPEGSSPKPPHRPAGRTAHAPHPTPLYIISLFATLSEAILGIAATQLTGDVQLTVIIFVVVFPVLVATAFFIILWVKPYVFYSPKEYGSADFEKFIGALSINRFQKMITKRSDLKDEKIQFFGNPDQFQLLFKVVGEGWKKSTKAMEVEGGCVIQVTSERLNPDGTFSLSEAVAFIEGVRVEKDKQGEGKHLSLPSDRT